MFLWINFEAFLEDVCPAVWWKRGWKSLAQPPAANEPSPGFWLSSALLCWAAGAASALKFFSVAPRPSSAFC